MLKGDESGVAFCQRRHETGITQEVELRCGDANPGLHGGGDRIWREPVILASIADPEGNVVMLTQYIGHE
jgi:hypothetical protein